MRRIFVLLFIAFLLPPFSPTSAQAADWQEIRDAILGKTLPTQEMDVNGDNQVDVADLMKALEDEPATPDSVLGEYVGILFRDNATLTDGQSGALGQMPFALKITNESPLQGEIDNRSDSDLGHYSLYFPEGPFPVTFLKDTDTEMDFELEFTTSSSNLSPDNPLTRKMVFEGEFSDAGKRVLSGTYTESISGFKDNRGDDIPVTLTGKFVLISDGQ